MPYTTINKSTDHFITHLYSGNDSTNNQTSVGLTPDFVWVKCRNHATPSHYLVDKVRGDKKYLSTNNDAAEATDSNTFDLVSGGFNLAGGNGWTNVSGRTYAAWSWKGGGAGTSNSDGSITSTVSANTTSGVSIVKYTGTGANATVGHGLGKAPKFIMFKDTTNASTYWGVYHKDIGNEYRLTMNTNAARQGTSANYWQSTDPTTSVFSIGSNSRANASSAVTIAYCFAEVPGFSKIGWYKGNNNADGPYITTGFKPAWVMIKNFDTTLSWIMLDNKRDHEFYPQKDALFADTTALETGDYLIDFNANGFKIRTATGALNGNAQDLAYIAFADAPLVGSNNVPCTAR